METTITYTRRVTEAAQEASRSNGKKGGRPAGTALSDEQKAKLKEAQRLRREREKAERVASGEAVETAEKKPVGRPRKSVIEAETNAPKRGRGRPKKSETSTNPSLESGAAENGT